MATAPGTPKTVQFTLPEGMTLEKFNKLFETFQKSRIPNKERDAAINRARKEVLAAHKDEFEALKAKYLPKKS